MSERNPPNGMDDAELVALYRGGVEPTPPVALDQKILSAAEEQARHMSANGADQPGARVRWLDWRWSTGLAAAAVVMLTVVVVVPNDLPNPQATDTLTVDMQPTERAVEDFAEAEQRDDRKAPLANRTANLANVQETASMARQQSDAVMALPPPVAESEPESPAPQRLLAAKAPAAFERVLAQANIDMSKLETCANVESGLCRVGKELAVKQATCGNYVLPDGATGPRLVDGGVSYLFESKMRRSICQEGRWRSDF